MRITQKMVREARKSAEFCINEAFKFTDEQINERLNKIMPGATLTGTREEFIRMLVMDAIERSFGRMTT